MKIAIFGAAGKTGQQLVQQALERGHLVTAFVRHPLEIKHDNLKQIEGDALNGADVEKAVVGQDAIVSALGFARRSSRNVCEVGVKNMISAMNKHGVKRLIVESAYGVFQHRFAGFYPMFTWLVVFTRMLDKEKMETVVKQSNLDWVIVRPVSLTNGGKRGKYHIGINWTMIFWPIISRADVADFMLKQLDSTEFLGKTPVITY